MKWSWKLGTFACIPVRVHAAFLLLIAWIALGQWLMARTAEAVLGGVAFVLALFVCVLLHEYGHALAARRFGIGTRDITMLPFGGLARLERMPEDPRQELWVALAGPAVNVMIAAALYLWLAAGHGSQSLDMPGLTHGSFAERLMMSNLVLALFNMLPAFPMDGGRVLRAVLASRMEYARATRIAAATGQGAALLFGLAGLFTNPLLVGIALIVWIGAAQEAGAAQLKALSGVPVHRAMITDFRALGPGDRLSGAADLILAGSQQDFPVVEDRKIVGAVTRADLVAAFARDGEERRVGEVMRRDVPAADPFEMLESALQRLQSSGRHMLPVVHHGELVGMLSAGNPGEVMMIRSKMAGGRPPRFAAAVSR